MGCPDRLQVKSVAVIARTAITHRGADAHEARQIFILGAETVVDPRPHARANEIDRARVHKQRARAVGHALSMHALEQAEIIHMLGHVREKLAYRLAALAVILEIPKRFLDTVLYDLARLSQRPGIIKAHHLAVVIKQLLLVVERINMAHAAGHEEKNHALCPGCMMHQLGGQRIIRRRHPMRHRPRSHRAKATRHGLQGAAARKQVGIHTMHLQE